MGDKVINSHRFVDSETRKQSIAKLRESNRQLELVALAFDDLIAMLEVDLRRQRRQRLEKKQENGSESVGR